jgi:hypothetical protein
MQCGRHCIPNNGHCRCKLIVLQSYKYVVPLCMVLVLLQLWTVVDNHKSLLELRILITAIIRRSCKYEQSSEPLLLQ